MELNREQIIKALEICTTTGNCPECPYNDDSSLCINRILKDAITLIKELTEEKEVAIDDLKRCMYYAKPKRANTCNFCIHDCEVSQDGIQCKGKEDWIYCSPVWRGVVKSKSEGE